MKLTEEDLNRNAMYTADKERKAAQSKFSTVEDYLDSLQIKIILEASNEFTMPRIAQLTQKTNQFNLTTKRYTQEDIIKFSYSKDYFVASIQVSDIYGDNGITGVCIVKLADESATIDTFLMSCRIMGRNVEYAFLGKVIELLRASGVKTIYASYKKTAKNTMVSEFYSKAGFTITSADENGTIYQLDEMTRLDRNGKIEIVVKGDTALWTKN